MLDTMFVLNVIQDIEMLYAYGVLIKEVKIC